MIRFFSLLALMLAIAVTTHGDETSLSSYQLGAGDVIRIYVYGEDDLTFDEILVGESGVISYPFLGEIRLKGLTIKQLEALLLRGLKPDYLVDPKISASIVTYRPFFVSGEVNSPGSYSYQPGLTVRQAISLAGGFSERASKSKITIVSADKRNNNAQRKASLNDEVRPGDSINVDQSLF